MSRSRLAALLAACAAALAYESHARPTAICNPDPRVNTVVLDYPDPAHATLLKILAAVQNPAAHPQLYERLRRPISIQDLGGTRAFHLRYEPIEDVDEIAQSIRNDAELAAPFSRIARDAFDCAGLSRPPELLRIVEFYHPLLDNYFLTALPVEIEWLDAGGAGGGWQRTGQAWFTWDAETRCADPEYTPVYRFFGTPGVGPTNSHFYTARPDECGWLRNTQGWSYLTVAFGARRPYSDVGCPVEAPMAVRRLYNNRASQNRSNHRFTSSDAIYAEMLAKGWMGEGVQFCVKGTALGW